MAILFSVDAKATKMQVAIEHLKNNNNLYWHVGFNINKSHFTFPLTGYMYINGEGVKFKIIIDDIVTHDPQHYLGPNAAKITPNVWIDNFKKNPRDWKVAFVISKIEELPRSIAVTEIKKENGEFVSWPPQGYIKVMEFNEFIPNDIKRRDAEMENIDISEPNIKNQFKEYQEQGRIEFITFHPSYSYEEFVEGITVDTPGENIASPNLQYKLKPGIFKKLCKRALGAAIKLSPEETESKSWKEVYGLYLSKSEGEVDFETSPKYVLIIDEINRGDIAKILGELITLLEADKRIEEENEIIATLPLSGDKFGVPSNLYIIGTMNTADRSIALLDVALRRRFGFVEMNPDFTILQKEHIERNKTTLEANQVYGLLVKSSKVIEQINDRLCDDKTIGRDRQIGHSFLFKVFTTENLLLVWKHEIFPLLEEYCYSDYRKINKIVFNKDSDTEWISESKGIGNIKDISRMLAAIE